MSARRNWPKPIQSRPPLDEHDEPKEYGWDNDDDYIRRDEHERQILDKNTELSRLAEEMKGTTELLERHRAEIGDLHGQIAFLQGEVARLEQALEEAHTKKPSPTMILSCSANRTAISSPAPWSAP